MLPPSVPRFWICAAPTSAAIAASTGACSATSGLRRSSAYVEVGAEDERALLDPDPAQLVERAEVEVSARVGDAGRSAPRARPCRRRSGASRPPSAGRTPSASGARRDGDGIVQVEQSPLGSSERRPAGRAGAATSGPGPPVREPNRVDDPPVAGAAAEVAGDRLADRGVRRGSPGHRGIEECATRHEHPGRTDPALDAAGLEEGGLERVEPAVRRQALDGTDLPALRPGRPGRGSCRRPRRRPGPSRRRTRPRRSPPWTPVRPRSRRSTSSSRRPPGAATSTGCPLTVKRTDELARTAGPSVTGAVTTRHPGPAVASRFVLERPERREDARRRRRQLRDPGARRVVDRVDHGGGADVHRQLAEALRAMRRVGERRLQEMCLDRGGIERRRDQVGRQAVVAVSPVDDPHLLDRGVADGLQRAALDLAGGEQRVHDRARPRRPRRRAGRPPGRCRGPRPRTQPRPPSCSAGRHRPGIAPGPTRCPG